MRTENLQQDWGKEKSRKRGLLLKNTRPVSLLHDTVDTVAVLTYPGVIGDLRALLASIQ